MNNIHPIYNIKTLMIKRELLKDPKLRNENWERFLPKFQHKVLSKRKQPMKKNKKAPYTPFPPAQSLSKIDKQLESGEYFLNDREKRVRKAAERKQKDEETKINQKEKRSKSFKPPKEKPYVPADNSSTSKDVDVTEFKKKVKNALKKKVKH